MYDWLRVPAAGVCTWRGRTFGRWTRHADWVCDPVWAVLDSGIGCRGRKVVLRDRRIYDGSWDFIDPTVFVDDDGQAYL